MSTSQAGLRRAAPSSYTALWQKAGDQPSYREPSPFGGCNFLSHKCFCIKPTRKIRDPLYTTFQKTFTIIRTFLKSEAPKALYSSHPFVVSALNYYAKRLQAFCMIMIIIMVLVRLNLALKTQDFGILFCISSCTGLRSIHLQLNFKRSSPRNAASDFLVGPPTLSWLRCDCRYRPSHVHEKHRPGARRFI